MINEKNDTPWVPGYPGHVELCGSWYNLYISPGYFRSNILKFNNQCQTHNKKLFPPKNDFSKLLQF